jgi:hypothetical protein
MLNGFKGKIYSILVAICLSAITALGQSYSEADFKRTKPPLYSTDEWYALNVSTDEFSVFNKNGQLEITKAGGDTNTQFKLPKGRLIGIDRGEFGGALKYIPNCKPKEAIQIKSGNVKLIFQYHDSIYFFEGLAHLTINNGALYRLDTANTTFTYTGIVGFEDAPEAFAIYNNQILIASHESFYILHNGLKKEVVLRNTFWRSLYPNSIAVIDEKHVYIGIRSGYVKLNLKTKELTFYKYR